MDISKWAIASAAKRNRAINWIVASNRRPPCLANSIDALLCLFGFPDYEAFAQVLKSDGWIVLVDPGPDHLIELRRIIYPKINKPPPARLDRAERAGFRLSHEQPLQFQISLNQPDTIADLLTMTPHLYRANQAGKEAAEALKQIDLSVDVSLKVLVKS
jgi:23S rRNA (guanine745-N1)-methyltransferase